jgi:cytochrome d ubiquinol oxidase subunit II
MEWYLPLIWAAVIGIAVVMYVLLDGFDLGIGILFTQIESNATMIVRSHLTGMATRRGGKLGGADCSYFPGPTRSSCRRVPVIVMLLALVFRGIGLNSSRLRSRPLEHRFCYGLTCNFAQGVILGGLSRRYGATAPSVARSIGQHRYIRLRVFADVVTACLAQRGS